MTHYYVKPDLDEGRAFGVIAGFFLVPALAMLLLGILAHQLHVPQLAIGYWETFVAVWIARLFQKSPIINWKVTTDR